MQCTINKDAYAEEAQNRSLQVIALAGESVVYNFTQDHTDFVTLFLNRCDCFFSQSY